MWDKISPKNIIFGKSLVLITVWINVRVSEKLSIQFEIYLTTYSEFINMAE